MPVSQSELLHGKATDFCHLNVWGLLLVVVVVKKSESSVGLCSLRSENCEVLSSSISLLEVLHSFSGSCLS